MKKNYVNPSSESVDVKVESAILAVSIPQGGGTDEFDAPKKNSPIWGESKDWQ